MADTGAKINEVGSVLEPANILPLEVFEVFSIRYHVRFCPCLFFCSSLTKLGGTALIEASESGNFVIVEFLLQAGADVNASDKVTF